MAKLDPLAKYNAKRDFAKTAEPAGTVAPTGGNRFIVQKHDATRLHWDFRLEVDGVLKSWAVTRGPSLDPNEKRLAVRTEDHPLSYADFEGTIPKGEYGGGTVMLWDDGFWEPIEGKSAKDLEQGHLHFRLDGERMKGEWLLIRLKPRAKEKNENWLLRKINDGFAGATDLLVETGLTSVHTGRTMQEIAEAKKVLKKNLPQRGRARAGAAGGGGVIAPSESPMADFHPRSSGRSPTPSGGGSKKAKAPPFSAPQLATLVDTVPTGTAWLHEVKYDGYRALVATGTNAVKIYTRSGLDWTEKFPGIAEAAATLPPGTLLDGEIVAFKNGKPDFSTLQEAISAGGHDLTLFAFDLLAGGGDVTALPQLARKERLRAVVEGADPRIQFSEHIIGNGEKLFKTMCDQGYEGIVSKRADAPYRGTRTKSWLKVKCIQRQEFVIIGWTPSTAKGRGFRSLLLGLNGTDGLRYAGKVGTGFSTQTLHDLRERFDRIKADEPATAVPKAEARGAHWLKPQLVAEVAFTEFTAENVVRHGSFLGLREDKQAKDVVPETPTALPAAPETHIKISSRERVIYPESGLTKGELADYYQAIAPAALRWLGNRPISLVRCPQGRAKHCFFQKHDAGSFGDDVHHVQVREKDGSTQPYLYVDDVDGMMACVQMGTIEFHGWGAPVADIERPDRLVFDLDPDEGLDFTQVKKAAEELKGHLADIGLTSWPLLSGGKGVHVVVPLVPQADWPAVRSFAERFARALAQAEPDRYTANLKKVTRKGKIFIDYLRNQRGATAVLPYVARAREDAPVAAPVTWSELRDLESAKRYTIRDAAELLDRAASRALTGWGEADQSLPDL
ncbi:DNA ligase D [Sphingomonas xinjiangensis]|uniref:DNA ligase (ATP) n=1 Tax=Sphingomonas xinjiangensis TaxID=643568 RepID=A0A840YEN2_9SPHN|nr:DNA ligase D [Sphingomonas xinjiangensis]MBB5711294.1 bifunctional non-homologous end joining protein LigD [Sphingomonas xinjiangensis]